MDRRTLLAARRAFAHAPCRPRASRPPRASVPAWRTAPGIPTDRPRLLAAWRSAYVVYHGAHAGLREAVGPGLARFGGAMPALEDLARLEAARLRVALADATTRDAVAVPLGGARAAQLAQLLDTLAALSREAR